MGGMIGTKVRTLADRYFDDDPPAGSDGVVDDAYEDDRMGGWTIVVSFPNGQMASYTRDELMVLDERGNPMEIEDWE